MLPFNRAAKRMAKKLLSRNCFICNCKFVFLIGRIDRPFDLYYCKNCSLIRANPLPTDESLKIYYQGFQFKAEAKDKFGKKLLDVFIDTKELVRTLNALVPIKRNPTLLDYGGSIGIFSNAFSKLGFKTTNVDIDKFSVNFAKKKFKNFKSVWGEPTELNLGKFDYIFCREVIEHIPNPIKLLDNLKRFMDRDTILILTTPNQQSWEFPFRPWWWYRYLRVTSSKKKIFVSFIKFIRKPWICCDPPRHLYSFNKKNLESLFKKNGLEVLKISTKYSHEMQYSGVDYRNWSVSKPKDIQRLFSNIYSLAGFNLLRRIDFKDNHGIDLVIMVRKGVSVQQRSFTRDVS